MISENWKLKTKDKLPTLRFLSCIRRPRNDNPLQLNTVCFQRALVLCVSQLMANGTLIVPVFITADRENNIISGSGTIFQSSKQLIYTIQLLEKKNNIGYHKFQYPIKMQFISCNHFSETSCETLLAWLLGDEILETLLLWFTLEIKKLFCQILGNILCRTLDKCDWSQSLLSAVFNRDLPSEIWNEVGPLHLHGTSLALSYAWTKISCKNTQISFRKFLIFF